MNDILNDLKIGGRPMTKNEIKINALEKRINKAIEYIEENKNKTIAPYGDNEDTDYETCLDKDEIKDLLEILKGEPNTK